MDDLGDWIDVVKKKMTSRKRAEESSTESRGPGATAASSANWGPGQVVDPSLAGSGAAAAAGGSSSGALAPASLSTWTWRAEHELPRWGQGSADPDLASVGQPATLTYPTLVDPTLACKTCGKKDHVRMLRHHPGGCGACEWTHGLDIDWRWTCCGKHQSFANKRKCAPNGAHETGCVFAPLCIKCFVCPCVRLIQARKEQEEDM